MGLAEPDQRVLYGSEQCLQLVVRDLLPRRRVQVPQWPPQSATVTVDLGFVVGLYYTQIQQTSMAV